MKLVIAGGTGMIGSVLAERSCALGHDTVVLSREAVRKTVVRTVQWDGATAGDWVSELEDADVVVNLCGASIGEGRWTTRRKAELLASRLAPSRCLAQALSRSDRETLYVQASAIGFYGAGSAPVDEQSTGGNDYLAQLAREWEAAAGAYAGPALA